MLRTHTDKDDERAFRPANLRKRIGFAVDTLKGAPLQAPMREKIGSMSSACPSTPGVFLIFSVI